MCSSFIVWKSYIMNFQGLRVHITMRIYALQLQMRLSIVASFKLLTRYALLTRTLIFQTFLYLQFVYVLSPFINMQFVLCAISIKILSFRIDKIFHKINRFTIFNFVLVCDGQYLYFEKVSQICNTHHKTNNDIIPKTL